MILELENQMKVFQSYRKQKQFTPIRKADRKAENTISVETLENANLNIYHSIIPKLYPREAWKELPSFNGSDSQVDNSTVIQGVTEIQTFKNEIFKKRLDQTEGAIVNLFLALEPYTIENGEMKPTNPKYIILRFTKKTETGSTGPLLIEFCQVITIDNNDNEYQSPKYYVDSDPAESLIRLVEEVKYGSKTHGILDFNVNLGYWKDVYLTLIDIPFMNQVDVGFIPRRKVYGYFIIEGSEGN